jgi:CelD/BcsL family acetyltransferase involved in cellulose biosynthesis
LTTLTVQELTTFEGLPGLREEWNGLVSSEKLGPSQSYEWLSTLWDLHKANRELFLLIVRDEQGITGIAPFVREIERRRGLRVRLLRMLSGFHSLHGTPLLLCRRHGETLRIVFDHLQKTREAWALWFTSYQVGDEQEKLLLPLLRERGYPVSTAQGVRSPFQRLEETWEQKFKSLQPRFRTALRSREKRLREKGKMELRFLDSATQWQEGLEAIREIEGASWKLQAGTAITAQDFQWQFYSRYSRIAAEAKTLRIPVLFLDGEPIAYDFALYEDGIYYLLKTSYKSKWHDSYPGFVLRKMLVEWTYAQGGREIDYLGKDEDWKMKWTSQLREHLDCFIYGRSLAARYLHGLHKFRKLLRPQG